MTTTIAAWGATAPDSGIQPMTITRRDLRADDVGIAIHYCGICHSDLHQARNDWRNTTYPVVPGHEIVGVVESVGSGVTRYKIGDRVAVGCLVDSCLECPSCHDHEEQYCEKRATATYNGRDRRDGSPTFGGYSGRIVVREEFVLRVPDQLDFARAAPLLCAGITTWAPLRQWGVGPGSKIAVAGLGGLGHMGVKLAAALGAHVTMLTTSPEKAADAQRLGAHDVLIVTDREAMKNAVRRFDLVLDTIPVKHELAPYISVLKTGGVLVIVGAIEEMSLHFGLLVSGRKVVTGSAIGGLAQTQEMLDFCAENDVAPDCEMIVMDDIAEAYERLERGAVKYRFVIDLTRA